MLKSKHVERVRDLVQQSAEKQTGNPMEFTKIVGIDEIRLQTPFLLVPETLRTFQVATHQFKLNRNFNQSALRTLN